MSDRIRRRMVLALYNLLLPVGLLLVLPGSLRKMRRRGGYGSGFGQRFGRFSADIRRRLTSPQDIWIHAVSVGEVGVAKKLIAALLERDASLLITLSTTTSTGHAVATESLPESVTVVYNPVDLPWVVERSIALIQPRQIVLVEAEVWPNLAAQAQREGIPLSLVNARLSDRSARRYARFRHLVAPLFGMLDRVLVQEEEDVQRWESLGVRGEAISLVGSLKYDQEMEASPGDPEPFRQVMGELWGTEPGPVVVAASTHAGEEAFIAKAVDRCRRGGEAKLVLVPRHMERRTEVIEALRAAGRRAVLRSEAKAISRDDEAALVVDSTGELVRWMMLADVVVIGKSFLGRGGQNPVEALSVGRAVVTGPHMQNFRALTKRLVESDGIVQVATTDIGDLSQAIGRMLDHPGLRKDVARNGREVLDFHRGANRRAAAILTGESTRD